ncbi:unnamed protein product, partial [Timema podura]|nr:unnamed protein product [Timema podura]
TGTWLDRHVVRQAHGQADAWSDRHMVIHTYGQTGTWSDIHIAIHGDGWLAPSQVSALVQEPVTLTSHLHDHEVGTGGEMGMRRGGRRLADQSRVRDVISIVLLLACGAVEGRGKLTLHSLPGLKTGAQVLGSILDGAYENLLRRGVADGH